MILKVYAEKRTVYRAFCRAIDIKQHHTLIAGNFIELLDNIGPQHLACQQNTLERQRFVVLLQIINKYVEKSRSHVAEVNTLLQDTVAECRRIFAFFVRHDIEAFAAEHRNRQLLDRRVKRQGRYQPHRGAALRKITQRMRNVQKVAVLHHHTLGLPGRAAGVDNVGCRIWPCRRQRSWLAGLDIPQVKMPARAGRAAGTLHNAHVKTKGIGLTARNKGRKKHFNRLRAFCRPGCKKTPGYKQLCRALKPQQGRLVSRGQSLLHDVGPQIVLAIHVAHGPHKYAATGCKAFYGMVKNPAQIIVAGKTLHHAVENHKVKTFIVKKTDVHCFHTVGGYAGWAGQVQHPVQLVSCNIYRRIAAGGSGKRLGHQTRSTAHIKHTFAAPLVCAQHNICGKPCFLQHAVSHTRKHFRGEGLRIQIIQPATVATGLGNVLPVFGAAQAAAFQHIGKHWRIKAKHVGNIGVAVTVVLGLGQRGPVCHKQPHGPEHGFLPCTRQFAFYRHVHGAGTHNADGGGKIHGPAPAQHPNGCFRPVVLRLYKASNARRKIFQLCKREAAVTTGKGRKIRIFFRNSTNQCFKAAPCRNGCGGTGSRGRQIRGLRARQTGGRSPGRFFVQTILCGSAKSDVSNLHRTIP